VQLLQAGCDDLGGTLMEETISRMEGADHGVRQDPEDLRAVAERAGRTPAERTTDYTHIAPDGIRYTSFAPSPAHRPRPGGTPPLVGGL
jgi:2-iminoacetate synthase ThiH